MAAVFFGLMLVGTAMAITAALRTRSIYWGGRFVDKSARPGIFKNAIIVYGIFAGVSLLGLAFQVL